MANRGNCSMESVVYYACKSMLFRAEKCIDILKWMATTIGYSSSMMKIIIIIEIKHLFKCPGQDGQQ